MQYKSWMIHLQNWTYIMNTALDEKFCTGDKDWKDLSQSVNRETLYTAQSCICNSLSSFGSSVPSKFFLQWADIT